MSVDTLDLNEIFAKDHSIGFMLSGLKNHVQDLRRRKHLIDWPRTWTIWAAMTDRKVLTR
jgi:hypothetical protein